MKNTTTIPTCLTLIPIVLSVAMTGCQNGKGIKGVDNCAEIPCGAIPAGPGTHVSQWQQSQVGKAALDRGVFYQADFISRTDTLSPAAKKNLARMIQKGTVGAVPLFIEASEEPQLDAARARTVASVLSASGIPTSPDQIQIAYPTALGLDGFRAQQVAGASTGGASTGGASTGGAGGRGNGAGTGVGGGSTSTSVTTFGGN